MFRIASLFCALLFFADCSAVQKNIRGVYTGGEDHWVGDGFKVSTIFPSRQLTSEMTSPFVLLDYNAPTDFSPSDKLRGVGAHPHRGFETVTFVYDGAVAHRDSSGAGGVIRSGDVQWMTAGSGVLHEEYHEKGFAQKGGTMEAVQLWVNLPAKVKLCSPRYQTLQDADMDHRVIDRRGSSVRVIAGILDGLHGPAETHTSMKVFDVNLKRGSRYHFKVPATDNTLVLVRKGRIKVNGKRVGKTKQLVLFDNRGEDIELFALEDSAILVMSGKPIREAVVQSGPFVMNTQQEIEQAWKDFHAGLFGEL